MKYILRSCFIFAAMCVSLGAVSCNFNASLPEFLEEYTRSVAGETYTLDDSYPRNAAGIECVPSGVPVNMTVYLRNPQRYDLTAEADAGYDMGGGVWQGQVPAAITVDPSERDSVTITFNLLPAAEGKLVTVSLRLSLADGSREFEEYNFTFICNTVPVVPVPVNYNGTAYTITDDTSWAPAVDGKLYWTYLSPAAYSGVEFIVNGTKKPKAGWNETSGNTILASDGSVSDYGNLYSVSYGGGLLSVQAVNMELESPVLTKR